MELGDFFTRTGQLQALAKYAEFARRRCWSIQEKLDMYAASRQSFSPVTPVTEQFNVFDAKIYRALKGWQVFRNSGGPCWTARHVFEALKKEFAEFAWENLVTLPDFTHTGNTEVLLKSLETMRELKPAKGYPVMAVSKFLHFYNPRLFPIYDYDVIWKQVFGRFKDEFRQFCRTARLPYNVEESAIFYRNYVCWASSLLGAAHPLFMQDFAEWLNKQPAVSIPHGLDVPELYATAFEFTVIGASQQELAATAAS